jgi:hypothetical protein
MNDEGDLAALNFCRIASHAFRIAVFGHGDPILKGRRR